MTQWCVTTQEGYLRPEPICIGPFDSRVEANNRIKLQSVKRPDLNNRRFLSVPMETP